MSGRPSILRVDIVTDAKGRGVDQTNSKLGKLGSIAGKAGKAVGAGLAVAGLAAGKMALDSIGAASRVQQSFGALNTVFGKSAAKVKSWASTAADQVGLAKGEYAELASVVGSQLQGMGIAQDKSAGKTRGLIKMGADLAATFGGSVSDAVGAVGSLLRGERDPIERYGVSIKQADVNARLAARGLDGLTGKAAKQAQAQVTLALLTDQTRKAQGAFGRESNTLAGQQERLGAKFENLKATIGKRLLPVATRLVGWVSNKMLPGARRLGKELSARFGPAFAAVGRFITGKVIPAAKSVYSWFVSKIAPGIKRAVTPILNGLRSAWGNVQDAIERNEPQLRRIGNVLRDVAEFVARKVLPILGRLIGDGFKAVGKVVGTVTDGIGGFVDALGWAIDKVRDLIGWFKNLSDLPGIGKVLGFITGSAPLATIGSRLVGQSPRYGGGPGGLSTAASSTWSAATRGLLTNPAGAGPAVVVRETVNIKVEGALDPDAVARQIETLLARRRRRTGRAGQLGLA